MAESVQCIGMKVDAFVLNPSVVADTYFVAPNNPPSYESLLPGPRHLRNDFVPPVDVTHAFPWRHNSRIADAFLDKMLQHRLGIYLHWCVPKVFRSGTTNAGGPSSSAEDAAMERPGSKDVKEIQPYQQRRSSASLYTSIITVLVDPYQPVHVRSGILPVVTAQLDRALVDNEISRLGVWLRAGPVLVGARGADPVEAMEREKGEARIQRAVDKDDETSPKVARVPVQTPPGHGAGGEWKWLQPVLVEREEDDGQAAAGGQPSVSYVRLGTMNPLKTGFDAAAGAVGNDGTGQRAEIAVALEGFLVLERGQCVGGLKSAV